MSETITVEALEDHTTEGELHLKGERYEAPAGSVDFLLRAGYAKVVEAPAAAPPADES